MSNYGLETFCRTHGPTLHELKFCTFGTLLTWGIISVSFCDLLPPVRANSIHDHEGFPSNLSWIGKFPKLDARLDDRRSNVVSANGAASRGPWPPRRGCAWQRRRSTRRTYGVLNPPVSMEPWDPSRFSLEVFCHLDPSFLLRMYFCDAMGT